MILTARVLCLLACFHDVAGFLNGSAANRAASLPTRASFDPGRLGPLACTIGAPTRTTAPGRESEEAADLEDGSDDDDTSDDVSVPWPFSAGDPGRQSLRLSALVTASGLTSTRRSTVLRC
jgi:hypothetical protein